MAVCRCDDVSSESVTQVPEALTSATQTVGKMTLDSCVSGNAKG